MEVDGEQVEVYGEQVEVGGEQVEVITNPGLVGGGVEAWDGSGQSSSDLKDKHAGHKSSSLKLRLYTVHSVTKYLDRIPLSPLGSRTQE